MTQLQETRGRPLIALILLMVAWVGLRAVFWNTAAVSAVRVHHFAALQDGEGPGPGARREATGTSRRIPAGPQSIPGEGLFAFESGPAGGFGSWAPYLRAGPRQGAQFAQPRQLAYRPRPPGEDRMAPPVWSWTNPFVPAPSPQSAQAETPVKGPVPVRLAIAHQMLWMAAISNLPLPAALFARGGEVAPTALRPSGAGAGSGKRWSVDSWLLLRKGGKVSLANGVVPTTYGASQLGAVLRYRLAPNSRHRPSAYLRTTAALNGSKEKEAAVGLSARPVPRFPLAVAAEMRATSRPGSHEVRPAVLGWTEIPPFDLPLGVRGEFYAQGGYVGGKFKTPFADGQLRADRSLATIGRAELRAGGGAWAGAQKGASRVDVGPSATMGVPISDSASARLGLDWRFRVTGNAEPKSGPAFTLSAGF